jgi:hypothetical protein
MIASVLENDELLGHFELIAGPEKIAWLFLSFASLITVAVLLDLNKESEGGFDPGYALDLFFKVVSGSPAA